MRLRRLEIENFRGIRRMTWAFDSRFVCLLGPGDSTKTSILDAIGAVLSPQFNLAFADSDFWQCDTSSAVRIEAVIVDLPDGLVQEHTQGRNRSGVRPDGTLEHDPLDDAGVDECLVVRLTVDSSLEPVWEVVRPGEQEGERLTASQRASLGFFRVGGDGADAHLRWGRVSALTAMTASRTDVYNAVIEAQRQARGAVANLQDSALHAAAAIAQTQAAAFGTAFVGDLRPGLDPRDGRGPGALLLHSGVVPLSAFGLGTRRLTSLAIQDVAVEGGAIVAIDELEHGLEPHRLIHLLRQLRRKAESGNVQVLFTTHSSSVVSSLGSSDMYVVRARGGETMVCPVPAELNTTTRDKVQGIMRAQPSALLARRVLVGEGATETGLLREALARWDEEHDHLDSLSPITAGVTVIDGGGDGSALQRAAALVKLGYPTLLVMDHDTPASKKAENAAHAAGFQLVQWPSGLALEDVLCQALALDDLQSLVDIAVDESSSESVRLRVAAAGRFGDLGTCDVAAWVTSFDDTQVRRAVAMAAKGIKTTGEPDPACAWFKRQDRGERLGSLIFACRSRLLGRALADGLRAVKSFATCTSEACSASAADG